MMSVPAAATYMVALNQQREQTVRYHKYCGKGTIAPCNASSNQRTIVENGQVVIKPALIKPAPRSADASLES